MTITTQPARNEFTANAGQTIFNYTFKIFENTDLNVYVTPAGQDSNDINDLTTNFVVTGLGDPSGGTITLTTATSINDLVTIVSNIPSNRTVDYQNNGDFRPDTVNSDFDRVVSIAKKIEDDTNRSLLSPQSQQGAKPLSLPNPVAGKLVRWKGDLSGQENVDVSQLSPGLVTDDRVVFAFATLAEAIASNDTTVLKVGAPLNIKERIAGNKGGATWDVALLSSVTLHPGEPAFGDIVACDGINTLALVLRVTDDITPRQFGVLGGAVETTTSFDSFWAFVAGKPCFVEAEQYLISDNGITIRAGTTVRTSGAVARYLFFTNPNEEPLSYKGGVDIILKGTGTKVKRANNVSSMEAEGGVVTDPTTGLEYRLENFSELFSAGVTIEHGSSTIVGPMRIIASYESDHYSGYNDNANTAFSDDWDCGLFVDGAHDAYFERVQVIGHYRKKGLFVNAAERDRATEVWPSGSCERTKFFHCNIQSGTSIRSNDRTEITAFDASTLSIPFNPDKPYAASGGTIVVRIPGNEIVYTYTSAVESAPNWVMSGLSSNPVTDGVSVGDEVRGASIGNQGLSFIQCFMSGLDHQTGVRATSGTLDTPLVNPSKILEISGASSGSVRLDHCTQMTGEDCYVHLHDVANVYFIGGFAESKVVSDIPNRGMRLITSPIEQDSVALNPKGTTSNLQFIGTDTKNFVDMSPNYEEVVGRFPALSGLNRCDFQLDLEKFFDRSVGDKLVIKTGKVGDFQLRSDATSIFDFRDAPGNRTFIIDPVAGLLEFKDIGSTSKFKIDGNNDICIIDVRLRPNSDGTKFNGSPGFAWSDVTTKKVSLADGISEPSNIAGQAQLFVDSADGDLKIKFGDGTVKTIVVDT